MSRKPRRNQRRQTREAKRFVYRLTARLLERGPDHPTAVQLGHAITDAQKESAARECSPNGAEGSVNGTPKTRYQGGQPYESV